MPSQAPLHRPRPNHLCGVSAQDIRVTSVQDGHCAAPEELSAGRSQLNLNGRCQPRRFALQGLHEDPFSRQALKTLAHLVVGLGEGGEDAASYVVSREVVDVCLGHCGHVRMGHCKGSLRSKTYTWRSTLIQICGGALQQPLVPMRRLSNPVSPYGC